MPSRVLVVDDSATVRRVVRRTLEQAGYEVVLAADGREALERVQHAPPDLVLVDFVMPQMNGFQLCQALRQIVNLATVPIVLMSAKADRIAESFLGQTGALDAITKPFPPEALLAVTGHALARSAEQRSVTQELLAVSSGEERISQPPPVTVRERSPDALAAAADAIGAKLRAAAADQELPSWEPARLFALIDELAALVPGRDGDVALSGRLEHVPLGDVLQILQHQRQTGVLEIDRAGRQRRQVAICLKEGAVELAIGRVDEQEFRLGRYVVREGLIDREELDRIVRNRGTARWLLGSQLVKLGYLSAEELARLLVIQTSELIYEALRWRRGGFRFLRCVDEWRLIEEQIRSFDDVLRRDEETLRGVDLERLAPEERRVLDSIDGARSVREIVEHARMGSFDACKVLFQLLTSRLVRVT